MLSCYPQQQQPQQEQGQEQRGRVAVSAALLTRWFLRPKVASGLRYWSRSYRSAGRPLDNALLAAARYGQAKVRLSVPSLVYSFVHSFVCSLPAA